LLVFDVVVAAFGLHDGLHPNARKPRALGAPGLRQRGKNLFLAHPAFRFAQSGLKAQTYLFA